MSRSSCICWKLVGRGRYSGFNKGLETNMHTRHLEMNQSQAARHRVRWGCRLKVQAERTQGASYKGYEGPIEWVQSGE